MSAQHLSDRYDRCFAQLKEQNQGAFIPFVTIGDPTLEKSKAIIRQLVLSGADALELGIPFSDPIADGPTIQAANIRALNQDIHTDDCFALIAEIRAEFPDVPIGLLLYSNLVMAKGIGEFYRQAAEAGVDSVLVADVPMRESKPFRQAALSHGVNPIFIAAPNANDDNLREVASYGRGYTYLLGRAGVTGTETAVQVPAAERIQTLWHYHAAPPVIGFGISTPQHVQDALAAGAAGAISGSAVVNIISEHEQNQEAMLKALDAFVKEMKAATQK